MRINQRRQADEPLEEFRQEDGDEPDAPEAAETDQSDEEGDSYVSPYVLVQSKSVDVRWSCVVCDEAQVIRNVHSNFNCLVRMLPKEYVHLVLATTALNHVRDYRSAFLVLWENADLPFDIDDEGLAPLYSHPDYTPDMATYPSEGGEEVKLPSVLRQEGYGRDETEESIVLFYERLLL